MQAIVCYLQSLDQFAIVDFAESPRVKNMPVTSGAPRCFSRMSFRADAAQLIQESMDGYRTRTFETTNETERDRFFASCDVSLLLSHIARVVRISVIDRKTGGRLRELSYPLVQVEVELLLTEQLSGLTERR